MSHTDAWDDSYENLPTDDNFGYEIDNYIRKLILAIRERMEIDHTWKDSVDTDGIHKKVTLPVLGSAPTAVESAVIIYAKDVSAKAVLFYEDEDGNEAQLSFPSGTIMLFGQNSAPIGWTRKADWQDNAMLCYAASENIGSGGSVNPQSAHTHGAGSYKGPSHTHPVTVPADGWSSSGGSGNGHKYDVGEIVIALRVLTSDAAGTGAVTGTSAENTAPHYQEVIAATKD